MLQKLYLPRFLSSDERRTWSHSYLEEFLPGDAVGGSNSRSVSGAKAGYTDARNTMAMCIQYLEMLAWYNLLYILCFHVYVYIMQGVSVTRRTKMYSCSFYTSLDLKIILLKGVFYLGNDGN